MSSISRRRTGLMAFSVIGGLLSWVRFLAPQSQDRTPASATPRDPSLATNYRGSGLVLRRVSPVARRPREGPLTEPIAGAQPRPQERVLMPQRRPPQVTGPRRSRQTPSVVWAIGRERRVDDGSVHRTS